MATANRDFSCELAGFIASAGFASGHRFVVGIWDDSPLGPMSDVMWARPGGERVLLAGRREVADFITAVYRFDRVEIRPLEGSVARFRSPAGFGFSEPPRWPSVVRVRPLLIDPSGDLARVVPDTAR